jgi:hypothetical protein
MQAKQRKDSKAASSVIKTDIQQMDNNGIDRCDKVGKEKALLYMRAVTVTIHLRDGRRIGARRLIFGVVGP